MGAPLALKHLRNIKTPQAGFSPDKILTNGGEFCPTPVNPRPSAAPLDTLLTKVRA
jgi:hypothetical protein